MSPSASSLEWSAADYSLSDEFKEERRKKYFVSVFVLVFGATAAVGAIYWFGTLTASV